MSSPRAPLQPIYRFVRGTSPLIVSMPHVGTELPPEISAIMTGVGRRVPDTDWYVDRLYDFVIGLGASVLIPRYSRYVIDLNRPPDDASLYAGQTHTGLCPVRAFDGAALYEDAAFAISAAELEWRREKYWQPYHDALAAAIAETQRRCGSVLLLDAHSIRSRVPRLFEGRLPDINLGTNDGKSCSEDLIRPVLDLLGSQQRFSHVLNGRFKGGYITRHYGAPARRVHALQIELAQDCYMDEEQVVFTRDRARPLSSVLQPVVEAMLKNVGGA
jgi:N-formylglutamate deformylase